MAIVTSILTGGTKEIPISKGRIAIVDAEDFAFINQWKWKYSNGRAMRTQHVGTVGNWRDGKRKDKAVMMHRVIMDAPQGMDVDHINGNPLDNRKSNLRICEHQQNKGNTKKPISNKSGYKGVSWDKVNKMWLVSTSYFGKSYNFGRFSNLVEAALEYDNVAKQLHGEYARLNFGEQV